MRTDVVQKIGSVEIVPRDLDEAITLINQDQGSWTILISPHRTHNEYRHLVYRARAAQEETLVAFHVTRLSPLGTAVLAEMGQTLVKALPPHQILPALAALESQIRCLTVTPSVIDMSEPKIPLLLHARSWIPGGTYIAERGHHARAFSARRPERALETFDSADEGYIAVVAESAAEGKRGQRMQHAMELLLEHLDSPNVVQRPNPDAQWWGSKHAAQIVLAPSKLGRAAREAATTDISADDMQARTLCAGGALPSISGANQDKENQ